MIDTKFILDPTGDLNAEKELVYFAKTQQFILHNLMSFRDLKQDVRTVNMADGSIIVVQSCFGLDTVYISCPKTVTEEAVLSNEFIECLSYPSSGATEYRYWDVKNAEFFMVPGNDGTRREVYTNSSDFSNWKNKLKRSFRPLDFQAQSSVDGNGNPVYYLAIRTTLSNTLGVLGVDNSWFVCLADRGQFWQEIKGIKFTGVSWWFDFSHSMQQVNNFLIQLDKPLPEGFPYYTTTASSPNNRALVGVVISPCVPLYAITKSVNHNAVSDGHGFTTTTDSLNIPVSVSSDSEGNCWCEAPEDHRLEVTSSSGYASYKDVISGADRFPWNLEDINSGSWGTANAYSSFEDRPICYVGESSSSYVKGNQNSLIVEYTACNTKDLWEDQSKSPHVFSTVAGEEWSEEGGADYAMTNPAIECANGAPGCNVECRTYEFQEWKTAIFRDYSDTISEVSTPFGVTRHGGTYAYHQEAGPVGQYEEDFLVYDNPPSDPRPLESGGVSGFFSHHTVFAYLSYYVDNGEYGGGGGPDIIRAEWKDSAYGVSPLSVQSQSTFEAVTSAYSRFDLVILRS